MFVISYLSGAGFESHQSVVETQDHCFQVAFLVRQQLGVQRDLLEKQLWSRVIVSPFVLQINRGHVVHARVNEGHEERR